MTESDPVILGLETSCDETAAAVVAGGTRVRSNVIATQLDLHRRYAGVVPEIASRAHLERIVPVVREALGEAGLEYRDLDAVAVGHRLGGAGPGGIRGPHEPPSRAPPAGRRACRQDAR